MFHRVRNVFPLDNLRLLVRFVDGSLKQYDTKPLLAVFDAFHDLRNEDLFRLVQVDQGGYGISWNENIDLSCDDLWEKGVPCDRATPEDLAAHEVAMREYNQGETVSHDDINWEDEE